MKAVMYHYVRPKENQSERLRFLDFENFKKQIDYFAKNFSFASIDDLRFNFKKKLDTKKVILTFDDGFKDHFEYVFPYLKENNIMGIFYVPTGPYHTHNLLDVHRIHWLIANINLNELTEKLSNLVSREMIDENRREEFDKLTYVNQSNTQEVLYIKKMLNYFLSTKYKKIISEKLMTYFCSDEALVAKDFYMNQKQIKALSENGMIVGSHSSSHPVFSQLSEPEQLKEITDSFKFIESLCGKQKIKSFCYPYGGFHSFSKITENILNKENCDFSFNVESRDITQVDIDNRPQALPRYDCNLFPHGQAEGF